MSNFVDKDKTVQVRIDSKWHKIAKVYATANSRSLRSLLEEGLAMVIPNELTIEKIEETVNKSTYRR